MLPASVWKTRASMSVDSTGAMISTKFVKRNWNAVCCSVTAWVKYESRVSAGWASSSPSSSQIANMRDTSSGTHSRSSSGSHTYLYFWIVSQFAASVCSRPGHFAPFWRCTNTAPAAGGSLSPKCESA